LKNIYKMVLLNLNKACQQDKGQMP
jgi:hypothetical protein